MRKLFSLFVTLLATTTLWAYDFQSGDLYYNITSDTTVEVTYQIYWSYSNYENLKDVVIPEKVTHNNVTYLVTSIGDNAFSNPYTPSKISSITIPNSVTSIGYAAFYFEACPQLISIIVEDGNTQYDSRDNCNAIIETATNTLILGCQNTIIPNTVTSIGEQAFYGCVSITSITIPRSVTSIGEYAFRYCSSLTSITIPNSVTSIGSSAFYGCSSLTSITIPNSVTSIGDYAFFYCSSLTSVTISNSVTSIGRKTFSDCSSLTSMVVEEGNTTYDSRDNCNAVIRTATNTLIAGCQNTIIPNSVTSIGDNAFLACSSLTSITIPNSVTHIGERAFSGCSSLTSVTIGNSVTSIGSYAFSGCSSLTSITIPNSVTWIGKYAFRSSSSLTSIVVENRNTVYDSRENCNAIIETATNTLIAGCPNTIIPNSVTSIGEQAFYGCNSLTSVTIPNSVTSIGSYAFSSCSALTSVTIPNSVTSIESWAFSGCTSLTSITCNATTPPTLGSSVFPSELTTAYIPCGTKAAYEVSDWASQVSEFVEDCYSNQKCGDNLFWKYNDTQLSITGHGDMYDYDIEPQPWMQYRSKMQTISLPDGMTSIGASAFANCKYVKSIAIPASVEKISDSAFEDCRMLSTITFAGSSVLTHIGNWAFYNNHELTSITIPEGGIEIGYAAFYGCTYLDELTLPASMEYIADNGFALCAKLRRINVNASTPPVVEARTFEDVDRSIPVYVPNTSIELYKAAPVWQEFNIVGKNNTTTDVDNIHSPITNSHKLIRNGQFIILRDGKTYNAMGQEM